MGIWFIYTIEVKDYSVYELSVYYRNSEKACGGITLFSVVLTYLRVNELEITVILIS